MNVSLKTDFDKNISKVIFTYYVSTAGTSFRIVLSVYKEVKFDLNNALYLIKFYFQINN